MNQQNKYDGRTINSQSLYTMLIHAIGKLNWTRTKLYRYFTQCHAKNIDLDSFVLCFTTAFISFSKQA